jgi:hypothetical protein
LAAGAIGGHSGHPGQHANLFAVYVADGGNGGFLFIWTIMIGAMIGVRESTHFEVDIWPKLAARGEALVPLVGCLPVCISRSSAGSGHPNSRAAAWADPRRLAANGLELDRLSRRAGLG